MAWKILLVVAIIFGIIFCLRLLVKTIVEGDDKEAADKAKHIEKEVFGFATGLIKAGQQMFSKGQIGRKPDAHDMAINAIFEAGVKGLEKLDPLLAIKKEAENQIKETRATIAKALANARKLSSNEAEQYLSECLDELEGIARMIQSSTAPEELEIRIAQIKADAESIAAAEKLDDAKNQAQPQKAKNYYEILGVGRNASEEEIKKTYRSLVQKYHPDKYEHLAEDMKKIAEERFKEINEANDTLSNAAKRAEYDKGL